MKTYKQLRQNSVPNSWESAWVMWRWTDLFHHYYFVLKTSGIEFGKKDTSCNCEQQVFLKTATSPTLKIDTWNYVKISSIGKHTTIWLDGVKVVDMDDPSYSKTADMSGGYIGLYNEDASSAFRQGDGNTTVMDKAVCQVSAMMANVDVQIMGLAKSKTILKLSSSEYFFLRSKYM